MTAHPPLEKPLRLETAADFLSVSVKTIRRLIQAGKLRAFKIGGLWFVRASAIEEYIQGQLAKAGGQ